MRAPRFERVLLAAAGLAAGAILTPARADDSRAKLERLEQNASQSRMVRDTLAKTAAELAAEIDGLRRQSVSAAEATQRHEAALSALEGQLASLGAEAAKKTAELNRDEQSRAGLLMALVKLARNPTEALALSSPDPVVAERGALVLGHTVPPLDRAARALRRDLKQLVSLRRAIKEAQDRHRAEQNQLNTQQMRLADVIARKSLLEHQAQIGVEQNDAKLAALTAEAASLKDLIDRLEAARGRSDAAKKPVAAPRQAAAEPRSSRPAMYGPTLRVTAFPLAKPPAETAAKTVTVAAPAAAPADPSKPAKLRSFTYAPGNYLVPASGKLVLSFGKTNAVGLTNQGLYFETRAEAQVVAPFDGRVLFAGPFKSYGQIVIIEHGDGYHSLLAGLAGLDVAVGQWLIAGEPVGVMPKDDDKPRLYLELRHGGQPINPLPWLATSNEKASG